MERVSGILLHPTSLAGRYGIGELGQEARKFADWLAAAGQRLWQVLPLGPTGYGESPYQLFSAFAGNHLMVSLDSLLEQGLLEAAEVEAAELEGTSADRVEFERVIPWKTALLRRAFERFRSDAEFESFCRANGEWLEPYAEFMALKEANGGVSWTGWDPAKKAKAHDVGFHRFLQYEFDREWWALKEYCQGLGIRFMGDLPIYVAEDSADCWRRPDLFRFDAVAGVPPDYFSATGQLWGNPLYRWERMAEDGYAWWVKRMRAALRQFDVVRIDHFRGFEAYWEVPAGEKTAVNGRWAKGPGATFFRALEGALGRMPIVAENLGVITPEVEAIREEFGYPGMAILQFAFGKDAQGPSFRPHNYARNLVAYTGTHDNDPVMGWWHSEGGDSTRTAEDVEKEKAFARAYLGTDGREMNFVLIRKLMESVADTVIFPMQDVLALGSEARMNTPSVAGGNWRWRLRAEALTEGRAARLAEMARVFDRG